MQWPGMTTTVCNDAASILLKGLNSEIQCYICSDFFRLWNCEILSMQIQSIVKNYS